MQYGCHIDRVEVPEHRPPPPTLQEIQSARSYLSRLYKDIINGWCESGRICGSSTEDDQIKIAQCENEFFAIREYLRTRKVPNVHKLDQDIYNLVSKIPGLVGPLQDLKDTLIENPTF